MRYFKHLSLLIIALIIALSTTIFISGWGTQSICQRFLYLELPPKCRKIGILILRFMCLETIRWMQAAELGCPQQLMIYAKGQHKVIDVESPWYNRLVAYTNRVRAEYSEEGEPFCLDEEEVRSLKENELVVEMLFTSPPAHRQGMLLFLTGEYKGWMFYFPGWKGKTKACGARIDNKAVIKALEYQIKLMLEAHTRSGVEAIRAEASGGVGRGRSTADTVPLPRAW